MDKTLLDALRMIHENGGRVARENCTHYESLKADGYIEDGALDDLWRPTVQLTRCGELAVEPPPSAEEPYLWTAEPSYVGIDFGEGESAAMTFGAIDWTRIGFIWGETIIVSQFFTAPDDCPLKKLGREYALTRAQMLQGLGIHEDWLTDPEE